MDCWECRGCQRFQVVEQARELRETICADPLQLLDRFFDSQTGRLGNAVEPRARQCDTRGAKLGGKFVRGAPLPAVVGADRLERLFEDCEVELRAQSKIRLSHFQRIYFARETETQHAQNMIGKGQAREAVRQLALEHITPKLAVEALEPIALAAREHCLELAA